MATADEIDDLLYLARVGELDELKQLLGEVIQRAGNGTGVESVAEVLDVVKDEYTGNGILHMAAGNGHLGMAIPSPRPSSSRLSSRIFSSIFSSFLLFGFEFWAKNVTDGAYAEILEYILRLLAPPPQNPTSLRLLNAQNASGNTALHYAALNGKLECVKLLVDNGADPTVRNAAGHDPVYEAEINDRSEVVEWVLREGGEGLEGGVGADEEGEGEGGEGEGEGMDVDEEIQVVEGEGSLQEQLKNLVVEGEGKGKERA
jgi:hypothetical protein